jgi:acetyl/propionyl-CoA carboxylase alpha subunit
MKYHVNSGSRERLVEVRQGEIVLDGDIESCEVDMLPVGENFVVRFRDRTATGFARRSGGGWQISIGGRVFDVRVDDERAHRIRQLAAVSTPPESGSEVRAPMPGLIVRVAVEEGQTVGAGESLVVMEAMKMENELRAESAGIVATVHVQPGSTVNREDLLITIERESA